MEFNSDNTYMDGVVKIRIEAVGGDLDRVACRYPVSFMNEMARQLTGAIESATGVTGIADSSVELVMVFAPSTYMEHISGNVTYRRLMLVDAVSAPRDFWIKWTRLEAIEGEYTADNILFELGEDVEQNIRQREYKYLLSSGKEKYHNSMSRKKVTEWREVIKRAARRGELGKIETDVELAPETLALEERIADLLGKKISRREEEVREEIPFVAEDKPENEDYARAMEKARQMVEGYSSDDEDVPVDEITEEITGEQVLADVLGSLEDDPFEDSMNLEDEELSWDEDGDEFGFEEEATEEPEATEEAIPEPKDEFDIFDEDEDEAEEEAELDIFADTEEDAVIGESDDEAEDAASDDEAEELVIEDDEEFVIEDEGNEEFVIENTDEFVLADDGDDETEEPVIEEEITEELATETVEDLPEMEIEIYEEATIEVIEEPAPEIEEEADVTSRVDEEPIVEAEVTVTDASAPVAEESTEPVPKAAPAVAAPEQPSIAERVADIRAELETKIRLEYEMRARAKAEEEIVKLRHQLQKLHTESELAIAELKNENERLRAEYDRLIDQIESERFTREAEEARRRIEEKQLREQIETQLRAEAAERERLAESARMAIEEQHRLEAENARIAREREQEERLEAERIRREEEHERELEAIRQAELDRIAQERAEALERAKNAMPDMGDGKPAYTSKTVRLVFRRSVDPNITTRIQQLIKSTVDYYGKDRVYLRIRATLPDTQTVVLEFADIPIEEMPLLGNIIKVLGNSGLGIAKAIIE